jgi:hypothetical protein
MAPRPRYTLRTLAALVLGFVTTVAVAWGLALAKGEKIAVPGRDVLIMTPTSLLTLGEAATIGRRARFIGYRDFIDDSAAPELIAARRRQWQDAIAASPPQPWLDSWLHWGDLGRHVDTLVRRRQQAFGFPLICLWYERSGGLSMFGSAMRVHGGYEITRALGRTRSGFAAEAALPLRPIWLGIAVNTLLYTTFWLGVLHLLARWRKARGARAGKCPNCRYDLVGLRSDAACPECGHERTPP